MCDTFSTGAQMSRPPTRLAVTCAADAPSLARCQAHFSLWCMMKAPLLTGADPTSFSAADLGVLTNADAISINQDPLGIQVGWLVLTGPVHPHRATYTPYTGETRCCLSAAQQHAYRHPWRMGQHRSRPPM